MSQRKRHLNEGLKFNLLRKTRGRVDKTSRNSNNSHLSCLPLKSLEPRAKQIDGGGSFSIYLLCVLSSEVSRNYNFLSINSKLLDFFFIFKKVFFL